MTRGTVYCLYVLRVGTHDPLRWRGVHTVVNQLGAGFLRHDMLQFGCRSWFSHHIAKPIAVGEHPGLGLVQHEMRDEALVTDRLSQRRLDMPNAVIR